MEKNLHIYIYIYKYKNKKYKNIHIYIYIYIYIPGCCLRGQNMLKYVNLRGRKIKGDKKVSHFLLESFF